jgi:hypothetical protein
MPSGALRRIVYISTAVGVLRADELDRIYLRAKSANARAAITGLMLFYEGAFLQVIEGPAAGVMSLIERLRRDRRHSGLITLEAGPIEARGFPDSPMHFVAARNLSAGEKQAFSDLRQAVSARSHMVGSSAPGADNGLWTFISAFNPLRSA